MPQVLRVCTPSCSCSQLGGDCEHKGSAEPWQVGKINEIKDSTFGIRKAFPCVMYPFQRREQKQDPGTVLTSSQHKKACRDLPFPFPVCISNKFKKMASTALVPGEEQYSMLTCCALSWGGRCPPCTTLLTSEHRSHCRIRPWHWDQEPTDLDGDLGSNSGMQQQGTKPRVDKLAASLLLPKTNGHV